MYKEVNKRRSCGNTYVYSLFIHNLYHLDKIHIIDIKSLFVNIRSQNYFYIQDIFSFQKCLLYYVSKYGANQLMTMSIFNIQYNILIQGFLE